MDKSQERYETLAEKWLNGTISPEEKEEFAQWYNTLPSNSLDIPAAFAVSEEQHRSRLLKKIISRRGKRWLIPAAAACVLLAGSASLVFWKMRLSQHSAGVEALSKKDISPGGNRAVLTMANGRSVVLEGLSGGDALEQEGVVITKPDTGILRYSSNGEANRGSMYNTLTTPRGGIFQVQLSDGTHVWLNSATSLRYPTLFSGATRTVFLTGQAYFEVAKNVNRPFVVHSGKVKVKVLGTAFDMMSYEDEGAVRTTLTQGSVLVASDSSSMVVQAGQQASLENGVTRFKLTEPDLGEILAWKEGRFRFSNTNI